MTKENGGMDEHQSILSNTTKRFDNFIVDKFNEFSYKVAKEIGNKSILKTNLLIIVGRTGAGKTHLLNAIVNNKQSKKNIILINTEIFLDEFTENMRAMTMDQFKNKYRKDCDLLLLDDIDKIVNIHIAQQELLYICNVMNDLGKTVVLTSKQYPKHLPGLTEDFQNCLSGGLLMEI